MEVMEVHKDVERTIWFVAPVSNTQVSLSKACLSMGLTTNIECWKLKVEESGHEFSMRLDKNEKLKLFYYSTYFCYYSWTTLHFLVLFMGLTVSFQLSTGQMCFFRAFIGELIIKQR